jgi:hypothetical protein
VEMFLIAQVDSRWEEGSIWEKQERRYMSSMNLDRTKRVILSHKGSKKLHPEKTRNCKMKQVSSKCCRNASLWFEICSLLLSSQYLCSPWVAKSRQHVAIVVRYMHSMESSRLTRRC